ncbi:hypothetical protein I3842_10G111900 [Carya illinoinensis]|uniref:Uncharacterized protein n=1 Tax=Carya illinoinensis TaxID=32201 RepID=A0A922DWX0_CARIL|nr:hypothetical protein I3842_10G111900 [Carya illinoinensis]KAG6692377.1 hypothetical protein I3842_10G111900 [Carya illinoinensis]KAG6692378.1 hypothetical protein I3842_10G111900 [Carya illinoinensis]KAG6692379.1 hypothetical protein I3842_10G111900 [Carya illinoinensis]KAG6692380.1 hypothetical protein I3842_10G111900 [Carya illinoinensis]
MSLGAFLFWESMDKLHVWIALHQDEKRLQSRTGGVDKFQEKISILQRLLMESNMKIEAVKRESRDLKSLLNFSFRVVTPLDRKDMQIFEEQERLKIEAKSLKFL